MCPWQFRIELIRDCTSCEPKSVKGVQVGGLLYHISPGNLSFFIGKKEIPLKLYKKIAIELYQIIQVHSDGTAWIIKLHYA